MAHFNSFINAVINTPSTILVDGIFIVMGEDEVCVSLKGSISISTSSGVIATHLGGTTTIFANKFAKVVINGRLFESNVTILTTQEKVQINTDGVIAITTIGTTMSLTNSEIEFVSGYLIANTREGIIVVGAGDER